MTATAKKEEEEDVVEQEDPLISKIKNGSFLPAIAAVENGMRIDQEIEDNLTLLHYACYYGHIKALRYIFKKLSEGFTDAKECL